MARTGDVEAAAQDNLDVREIATASGHVFGHATLQAPAKLNALSQPMIDGLTRALERWAADGRVAGVVLDGDGDKGFCAGGDVATLCREILARRKGEPDTVPVAATDFFEREYRLDFRIHTFPKPVLCWGHGIVMGGGIGLMSGASHRVVVPNTRMAMPEINIGLFPDVGSSRLFHRMPGRSGLFFGLTGALLGAADARFAGLADFVLLHEDHQTVLAEIAATHWSGARRDDAATLTRLLDTHAVDDASLAAPLRDNLALIDETIGLDSPAETAARLRALASSDDAWLATAAATFVKGSPTTVALTWELARRSVDLSLADVFRLEYQVSIGCCAHNDFPEGVRALLIDKDRRPHWRPATLDDVSDAYVAEHFAPRFSGAHPLADL